MEMTTPSSDEDEDEKEAVRLFERAAGISSVPTERALVGNLTFLRFVVGRDAPLYKHALFETQRALSEENAYAGALGLTTVHAKNFPASLESRALLTLLARSTKEVAQGAEKSTYAVGYVPFQGREDHQLAQPANHIVLGRRGVGKSTLIRRAEDLLRRSGDIVSVLDAQAYAPLTGPDLTQELFVDICESLAAAAALIPECDASALQTISDRIQSGDIDPARIPVQMKRALSRATNGARQAFVFLDDFHLIEESEQPGLLDLITGGLKGANGWLKIAGLASRLSTYDPRRRKGLQVPGDAQYIMLDLTLTDPEGAEKHLGKIMASFLQAVGYSLNRSVIPDQALRRLVWANAGVPRDFLQMFGRSLEHAQRNRHSSVTLSDVNISIGEFGQQKMEELEEDARNVAGELKAALSQIERYCLGEHEVNAFLVRSEESVERRRVRVLADLRMLHLIHQSITPSRAGERYEAYILDYSIFTGFRRRKNIREMLPKESQFRASELRELPRINPGFLADTQDR